MAAIKHEFKSGGGGGGKGGKGKSSSKDFSSGSESGANAMSVTATEDDSEFSDSGAGFLGGIGDFDSFLNNVQGHVTPSQEGARKRKGSKQLDDPRAGKNDLAGAATCILYTCEYIYIYVI